MTQQLPIAIIGAGPVGLAAAAHLAERKLPFVVLEAGEQIAASVQSWGHVRLFSPWRYVIDEAARALLGEIGWQEPDLAGYPTGTEIYEQYLAPLAATTAIAANIRTNARVRAITRLTHDKMKDRGRADAPFVVQTVDSRGMEARVLARAVIDASGTYTSPNPAGADGLPALGEELLADSIYYGIPDVLGRERRRYAGKRVLVLGSGHSAFNALLDLAPLGETSITWGMRRYDPASVYGGGAADGLEERGKLGDRARQLVESGAIMLEASLYVERFEKTNVGIIVHGDDQRVIGPFDEIVVCTGFRPELGMLRELRLNLDSSVEAPQALAPLIDPNVHSCGSVPPHGVDELAHPESGFYIVGMKSYGRAPTFLLLTGYEQVRSVAAALAGDWVAARNVQLVLPETGVCSGGEGAACCGPTSPVNTLQLVDLVEFRR
jgi:thioredoxin reductase